MLEVTCSGSPHDIGKTHGTLAKEQIARSLIFYEKLFQKKSSMNWTQVKEFAEKYQPYLKENWPSYVEEMEGVASGAGLSYLDILALNVRTEIAFGTFSDGCTAFSWKSGEASILAQNWDWESDQSENLIALKIKKENGLRIQMITEAGIIGKIGFNSKGVGCTLNALKLKGVSYTKIPCHLALRTVMESDSRKDAIETLEKSGVASACHILVADETGGTGLECTDFGIAKLEMNESGVVAHTNHFLLEHTKKIPEESTFLADSPFRVKRIGELLDSVRGQQPAIDTAQSLLKDGMVGSGAAICRRGAGENKLNTLFSIAMDLKNKTAKVLVGWPDKPQGELILNPGAVVNGVNGTH
ncbi:acyl-coenzyme A:6-aminopenicillanic acid acyl-transferase-domain-containing protein [Xylogone sp. PMI_703]|nr:acyl-coenzyme A:6-aminopenicillanic acid acyl-transferase-domain-containing protein [Xylogone sp. PMI_703]